MREHPNLLSVIHRVVAKQSTKPSLRLRVTTAAEKCVRQGHPWVFSNSVRAQNREGQMGEMAILFDRQDRFLAIGLFDPDSPIRVRILHAGKARALDQAWWQQRADDALDRRRGMFDSQTTGFRCINGESDGWPGLILDRYDNTLVLKIYSAVWLPRLPEVTALLGTRERIVLRLSRNIQRPAEHFELQDGQVLQGGPVTEPVVFMENGWRFEADVLRGQKTGFFLDQRENRRETQALAAGRNVLNLFSYTGGFSVYAAGGGAESVCSVDISEHALAGARRNIALNGGHAAVAHCRHETIHADAFLWLKEMSGRRFDFIVLDPPSLAKRESERPQAENAYAQLIAASISLLRKDGVLLAASCSAHVSAPDFFVLARAAARTSRRRFEEMKTTRHPADHPASFPEADYLKCIYLRMLD